MQSRLWVNNALWRLSPVMAAPPHEPTQLGGKRKAGFEGRHSGQEQRSGRSFVSFRFAIRKRKSRMSPTMRLGHFRHWPDDLLAQRRLESPWAPVRSDWLPYPDQTNRS